MDLSVYITELLNEHGNISIPKIGVFKQVRKRGYYNADEGKLYPPYFQTEFKQQAVEDDSLLQYLTSRSKVSASSAKYFMDKYLQNILQQAEIGEVMLGKLGWLSKEEETLSFRPAITGDTPSAAFGFVPVSIKSELIPPVQELIITEEEPTALPATAQPLAESADPVQAPEEQPVTNEPVNLPVLSVEKDEPVQKPSHEPVPLTASSPLLRQHQKPEALPTPTTVAASAPVLAPQQIEVPPTEPVADEPAKPFYQKPWFYGVLAAAAAIAIFLYFNQRTAKPEKPATVAKVTTPAPSIDSQVVKAPPTTKPIIRDTTAKPKAKAESVITAGNKPMPASTEFAPEVETPAATSPVLVNSNNYKFMLMSGAFSSEEAAKQVVTRYKAIGVPAAILKNVSLSKYVKVTLGFFKTYAEGQAAKVRLVKLKHLRSSDLYVETLRTNKK
ncbi:SPOR domain-containing protein [Mucilaginibacter galii]|uniref:SPOR domain-containing protein n=1 Tax=Mucilaginibacter galii TaxID=2005073 RepID=A0A917MZR2_9SPHI|nr:SPOR domain-containing protein [Mucilaginibacter galii]GGI49038.1 hypothetical protein GCM10011425_02500 [Mucilaginibacter galii]